MSWSKCASAAGPNGPATSSPWIDAWWSLSRRPAAAAEKCVGACSARTAHVSIRVRCENSSSTPIRAAIAVVRARTASSPSTERIAHSDAPTVTSSIRQRRLRLTDTPRSPPRITPLRTTTSSIGASAGRRDRQRDRPGGGFDGKAVQVEDHAGRRDHHRVVDRRRDHGAFRPYSRIANTAVVLRFFTPAFSRGSRRSPAPVNKSRCQPSMPPPTSCAQKRPSWTVPSGSFAPTAAGR